MKKEKLKRRINKLLIFFSVALILSGLTAIPIEAGIHWLSSYKSSMPANVGHFILQVEEGIIKTANDFPFLFYGYDWLAFAHIIIAIFFIGPIKDPVKNLWVIEAGMIACLLIFPFAFLFGTLRGIPHGWMLVDCSFGVIGLLPLFFARKYTILLREQFTKQLSINTTEKNEKGILV